MLDPLDWSRRHRPTEAGWPMADAAVCIESALLPPAEGQRLLVLEARNRAQRGQLAQSPASQGAWRRVTPGRDIDPSRIIEIGEDGRPIRPVPA
jgi:hypothetical protein